MNSFVQYNNRTFFGICVPKNDDSGDSDCPFRIQTLGFFKGAYDRNGYKLSGGKFAKEKLEELVLWIVTKLNIRSVRGIEGVREFCYNSEYIGMISAKKNLIAIKRVSFNWK